MSESTDGFDYAALLQSALRDLVRRVLERVAQDGLPGDHHFFISFRTTHSGVELPRFLREQYPEEMTIVLQHQFWDLAVDPDGFEISLAFGTRREPLRIPFAALTGFADPSEEFGLRFDPETASGAETEVIAALPALSPAPRPVGVPAPSSAGAVVPFRRPGSPDS